MKLLMMLFLERKNLSLYIFRLLNKKVIKVIINFKEILIFLIGILVICFNI